MPVSMKALRQGIDLMVEADLKNPPEFTAKKLATWVSLFEDWDDEMFGNASIKASRSMTFFPSVGELRQTAGASKEDAAVDKNEAWEMVRAAIRRHGAHASLTAEDVGGDQAALWALARMGAQEVGMMTTDDRAIKAAEFRRLYDVAKTRKYTLEYLAGKFETDNQARGLDVSSNPALLGRASIPTTAPALIQSNIPAQPIHEGALNEHR